MRKWMLVLFCAFVVIGFGCSQKESGQENQKPVSQEKQKPVSKENQGKTLQDQVDLSGGKDIRYGPSNPKYVMNVRYDDKNHQVSGEMSVQFTNNLDRKLNKVYFNLWPNAPYYKEGGIQVSDVEWNNKKVPFQVKKTKLEISGLSFDKEEQATVKMKFTVTVPKTEDRFGWNGTTVSLGNWFPILAVYDNEGWNLDPYFQDGESFYSLTGDFDVTLTTDKKEVVAATGQEMGKVKEKDGEAVYHFKADHVRDFAMEMNPNYQVKTKMLYGIKLNVYYSDDEKAYAEDMMTSGIQAVKAFNQKFGRYPWKTLDIVGMKGWFGGMEYPQFVMISFNGNHITSGFINMAVSHEIAHQWFYGVVGDNEYDEPWLDESFASFAAAMISGNLDWMNRIEAPQESYYHLNSPVSVFVKHGKEGKKAYGMMIYNYGEKTLNDLRMKLGDKIFYKAMHQYYETEKFKVATTSDFIRIMEKSSGKNLVKFFEDHRIDLKTSEK